MKEKEPVKKQSDFQSERNRYEFGVLHFCSERNGRS